MTINQTWHYARLQIINKSTGRDARKRKLSDFSFEPTWEVALFATAFPGEEGVACCTVRICCPKATFKGTPTVFCGELGGCEATDTTVSWLTNGRLPLKRSMADKTNFTWQVDCWCWMLLHCTEFYFSLMLLMHFQCCWEQIWAGLWQAPGIVVYKFAK